MTAAGSVTRLLLVSIVMLLILWFCCAMTLSRVLYSEQGITNKCQSNLTSIAIAMHRYHEKYGSLPPAYLSDANGKPMHSWRVLILEFIDTLLFEKYSFSEPWNGPSNSRLSPMMPSIFRCDAESGDGPSFKTSYLLLKLFVRILPPPMPEPEQTTEDAY